MMFPTMRVLTVLFLVTTLSALTDGKTPKDVLGSAGKKELKDKVVSPISSSVVVDEMEDVSRGLRYITNSSDDNHCSTQETCEACSELSSFCHWCEFDNNCHAIGSIHGCTFGMSCDKNDDDDKKKNKDACSALDSCTSCANTHTCHWCAHDNACHTIGSIYGCMTGVDCYSNDVCKREESEPIDTVPFTQMSSSLVWMTSTVGFIVLCCASTCLCCLRGVKGAFDDLADITAANGAGTTVTAPSGTATPLSECASNCLEQDVRPADLNAEATQLLEDSVAERDEHHRDQQQQEQEETETGYTLIPPQDAVNPQISYAHFYQLSRKSMRSKHVQSMYRCCVLIYVVFAMSIIGAVLAAIHFYPKVPEYNICNDRVAWTSLIESIAEMKVDASFEMLMSIENTNHLDLVLDMGRGTIKHGEVEIGTYEVPPITADAMAISDVLIVATVTPEKWEALSLTREYYSGNLVLYVDGKLSLRMPKLFNHTFQVTLEDIEVNVNAASDRRLCACQKWDNQTKTAIQ